MSKSETVFNDFEVKTASEEVVYEDGSVERNGPEYEGGEQ